MKPHINFCPESLVLLLFCPGVMIWTALCSPPSHPRGFREIEVWMLREEENDLCVEILTINCIFGQHQIEHRPHRHDGSITSCAALFTLMLGLNRMNLFSSLSTSFICWVKCSEFWQEFEIIKNALKWLTVGTMTWNSSWTYL